MTYERVKVRYRIVSLIGSTRKVKKRTVYKSKCYSYSIVIPSAMARQLSINKGDIIRFEVQNKSLILEKVNLSD